MPPGPVKAVEIFWTAAESHVMQRCGRLAHYSINDGNTTNRQSSRGVYVNESSAEQPITGLFSQE